MKIFSLVMNVSRLRRKPTRRLLDRVVELAAAVGLKSEREEAKHWFSSTFRVRAYGPDAEVTYFVHLLRELVAKWQDGVAVSTSRIVPPQGGTGVVKPEVKHV